MTTEAKELLQRFKTFLMSADCGMRKIDLAESYVRQVRVAWGALSPKFAIENLLEHHTVRDRFINYLMKQQKPGTVKSYISALHLFMDFMITEKVVTDIQRVHAMKISLNGWLKSGSRLCRERHFENLERAKGNVLMRVKHFQNM